MSMELVTTGYGPPALAALAEAVAQAKGGDPLAPVTVVVPSHYVGLAARRALGRRAQGMAAVSFHTAYSLAEHLGGGAMAAEGRRGVTSAVIAAAVRTALRKDPGHFRGVETHPATERALTRAHRELSELDDDQLGALGRQSRRARDVVRIHREVATALRDGFSNEQQLARAAATAVRAHAGQLRRRLGPVIVFLPQSVTGSQAHLLRAVSEATATGVVAGLTGADDADAAVRTSLRRLGISSEATDQTAGVPSADGSVAPEGAARSAEPPVSAAHKHGQDTAAVPDAGPGEALGAAASDDDAAAAPDNNAHTPEPKPRSNIHDAAAAPDDWQPTVRALSVSDADDEVRHAVRAVVDAARTGTPFGRCAILYGLETPYVRLVGDALDAAGIPRCGATVHTVETSLLGRSLLEMLALQDRGFSRRSVMAWLAGAPVSVRQPDHSREPGSPANGRRPADAPRGRANRRTSAAHTGEAVARAARERSEQERERPRCDETGSHQFALALDGGDGERGGPAKGERPADVASAAPNGAGADGDDPAGFRWRGVPSAAWEREARAARVDAGIDSWKQRLERYAADCRADAEAFQADEEQLRRADRLRRRAEQATELLDFVQELHSDLNPRPAPVTWAALATWCQNLAHKYLGGRLRRRWPQEQRDLAERVDGAISRLGDLDGTDDAPSLDAFRRALQLELETLPSRHGRLGVGVLVGPVDLALGMELDLAVVCGMAEGTFPARHNDDALLPDRERRIVGWDLPARGDRSGDEHRALLAVLAASKQSLLLCPRGDLRQAADRAPSRWLTEHAGRPEVVPSFVGGLRRTAFPAHQQEYDTRCLLDWHDADSRASDHGRADLLALPSVLRRAELRRGIDLRRSRRSSRLTRFDGNLAAGDLRGAVLPDPTDGHQVSSASRLETWADCPHRYFVRYILRVEAIDDADDDHRITALERGSLVHRMLERWLQEAISHGAVPAPAEPWPERWRTRLLAIGEEECDRLEARGLVGSRLYWNYDRRQILNDLHRFLDFDDSKRADHQSRPVAAELGFGMPRSDDGPVDIDIDADRSVRIRGSIDRIDVTGGGGLLVVDYKTGSTRSFRDLSLDNPTLNGQRFQLVLYDLAARRLRDTPDAADGYGAYWFVSSKGLFTEVGYSTDAARGAVLDAVGSAVDGIGAGLFPLHPEEPGWKPFVGCDYCEPDGLGTADQWRDWQRKQRDPALAPYLDLVDPDREQGSEP